ncbi:hypothetical protein ACEPAG_9727 [Sanghuangporus baumii]
MPFNHVVVAETLLITILRTACFYACATRVLRSVYHDLQALAGSASRQLGDDPDDELELESLPAPSTANDGPLLARSNSLAHRNRGEHGLRTLWSSKHSNISRLCFSLCFSESCTLFFLFMCQEVNIFAPRSRMLNWRLSLFVLLLMILFFIPLSLNYLLTYQSSLGRLSRNRSVSTRVMMTLIPYVVYLFAFTSIPLPESLSSANSEITTQSLSKLIALGTFIIGLLSGFGAARNSWDYLPEFSKSRRGRTPSEQEIRTAEEALERIRNDLLVRRVDERRLENSKMTSEPTSWMSRVASSITGNSELTSVQREISGLVALEYQMDRNLDEMRKLYANSRYDRTLQGKIIRWSGFLFAVYCAFRTLSCILNILTPFQSSSNDISSEESKSSYTDLIAHFLTYLVSLLPFVYLSAGAISAIAQQVSLGFVGIIILSSIRFVLRAVSRILKITSQNLGASLLLLILAQLMGTYLLSTLVQLRTAFPPKNADSSNVFSTLPSYEVFGATFDYSYLLSAIATVAYLWFDERINTGGSQFGE